METFYTAIGKFEIYTDKHGKRFPVVRNGREMYCITMEELLIWSSLLYTVCTFEIAEKLFHEKEQEYRVWGTGRFEDYMEQLEQKGLVLSGTGWIPADAIYDLIGNLHIFPRKIKLSEQLKRFCELTIKRKIPMYITKRLFTRIRYTDDQKKLLKLLNHSSLSADELIYCIDHQITEIPSPEKLSDRIWSDSEGNNWSGSSSENRNWVIQEIVNLYLWKQIDLQIK